MPTLPDQFKSTLGAESLTVTQDSDDLICILDTVDPDPMGFHRTPDSCILNYQQDQWYLFFPIDAGKRYSLKGQLEELLPLILKVYRQYRKDRPSPSREEFDRAIRAILNNPDRYRI